MAERQQRQRIRVLSGHLVAANDRLLAGLRVVELATVMAAPGACAILADFGAEVIKVENPRAPDTTRSWGRGDDPSRTASPELNATVEGGGSAFVQLNRGKKCIALDPTKPEGNALAKRLIGTADIFVTNVRQQSLQKQGLDYESLSKEFPSLIYGHLTAFGRAGEMMNDPGERFSFSHPMRYLCVDSSHRLRLRSLLGTDRPDGNCEI